jgi:uncharacterized membrane protein YtjA (UPF0391 family)
VALALQESTQDGREPVGERRQLGASFGRNHMLNMALMFLVLALVAALLGFSGIAGASANIAWILFVIFLVLTVVSFAVNALRGRPPI